MANFFYKSFQLLEAWFYKDTAIAGIDEHVAFVSAIEIIVNVFFYLYDQYRQNGGKAFRHLVSQSSNRHVGSLKEKKYRYIFAKLW